MNPRRVLSRFLSLFAKGRLERELQEEIASHIEALESDYRRAGLSPEEAYTAARRAFGAVEAMKEEHREQRAFLSLESVLHDLVSAARNARRSFRHSALVVLTISVGIAGSAAALSVYDRLFVRPLPFVESSSLVHLDESTDSMPSIRLAYANFLAWRDEARSFESMAAWAETGYNLSLGDSSERIVGARVTHDLDEVLGIVPHLGRSILAAEARQGGDKSAVLSYPLWQRRFGARAEVLGTRIQLNGESHTIVGVLPKGALFPDRAEIWTPLQANPDYGVGWFLLGVGRLAKGQTLSTAQAELETIQAGLAASRGDQFTTVPALTGLREHYLGGFRSGATAVLASVCVVLLVACGNSAALLLVAAARRRPELATRRALGASRTRVIRQLTTESLFLSVVGGSLGAAAGWAALQALMVFRPAQLPSWMQFELDGRFLASAIVVALVAGLAVGLLSAARATRSGGSLVPGTSARGTAGKTDRRSLELLVVGQVGLTLAVLIVASLLYQAWENVRAVEPGFDPEQALTFTLNLPRSHYAEAPRRTEFFQAVVQEAQALPGVRAVGAGSLPPLSGYSATSLVAERKTLDQPEAPVEPRVMMQSALGDYFGAMGIPLIQGRLFESDDRGADRAKVVIVNESLAKHYFGTDHAIGQRLRYKHRPDSWMTIIGVCADVLHHGPERDAPLTAYVPLQQVAETQTTMTFVVRAQGPLWDLSSPLRHIVRSLDPAIPLYGLVSLEERLAQTSMVRRAYTWLASVFAILALFLTLVGFHGATSYLVRQRRREIGLRLALGEQRRTIQRRIVTRALSLAAVGVCIGLLAGGYAASVARSLFFGLPAWAPVPIAAACALVLVVVLVASWFPATQAARTDPRQLIGCE